jgi:hypothetical protein
MKHRDLTQEELEERQEYYKIKYREDRFRNYPTASELMDAWDKKEETGDSSDWDALLEKRAKIKQKYPKQYPPENHDEIYGPITTTDPIEENDD